MKTKKLQTRFLQIMIAMMMTASLTGAYAHTSTQTYDNFSQEIKVSVENRLIVFLDRVDRFDKQVQDDTYRELQNKIGILQWNYAVNSEIYTLLEIIDLIAEHKLDSQSILTNDQILSHILFWEDIPHYNTKQQDETAREPEENKSSQDTDTTDNSDTNNTPESAAEYRADLDTEDLNELEKNILAGTAKWVLHLEVRANLEWVESETVEFRFNQDIENIGLIGRLYKNWFFVWESSQSDARWNTLTIDNLEDFIIDTETGYIQLELVTAGIWEEQIGKEIRDARVVSTTFRDNTWVITWDTLRDRVNRENSQNFSIVPADISVSLESEINRNSSTANIRIIPLVWNNNENGSIFSPRLSGITLQVSSLSNPGIVHIFNGNGLELASANISWNGDIFIALSPDSISSSGEQYRITSSAEWNFRISQDGFQYTAWNNIFTSRLQQQIFLGQR